MSASTITILFLIFAIVSFILEKIPLGLTATIVAIGLNVTGVLDASQTFSGYVNSNVILCVGMFVVGQALFETGMANKIGGVVTRFAKMKNPDGCLMVIRRSHVRIPVKYRDRSSIDPSCLWNCRRIRIFQKPPAHATGICSSTCGNLSIIGSTGKSDGCGCPAESW